MGDFERPLNLLFPTLQLSSTPWYGIWKDRDHASAVFTARIALPIGAIVSALHYFLVDTSLGLTNDRWWAWYRFGVAGLGMACLALTMTSAFSQGALTRVPLAVFVAGASIAQAWSMTRSAGVPYVYAFILPTTGALLLRTSALKTVLYLLVIYGLQIPAFTRTQVEPQPLWSALAVTIMLSIVLRAQMPREISIFISEQEKLETEKKLHESKLDLSRPEGYWTVGSQVGKYVLLAPLAKGGMAEVWIGRQKGPTGFSREVVLKRILAVEDHETAFINMFLDEARIVAQLNHPNIVQIVEFDLSAGNYFMAMEYLHGESMAHLVRQCLKADAPLSIPLAVFVVAEAAAGLGYAHLRRSRDGEPLGIVHRDISPQNIVVTYDGMIKVVDFGIAQAKARATETASGVVKGKMSYMAPEQAAAKTVDARADVFALGVVLFEAVTGTRLYGPFDDVRILTNLMAESPLPSARSRCEKVPVSLDAIIARALSKDIVVRFSNASALNLALMDWLRTEAGGAPWRDELSGLMTRLFSNRIEERERLLASAPTATPAVTLEPEKKAGYSPDTMPGITPRDLQ